MSGSFAKTEKAEGMPEGRRDDRWLGTIFLSQDRFQMSHHLGQDGWPESKSALYKPDFSSYTSQIASKVQLGPYSRRASLRILGSTRKLSSSS
jgi:hypothetical protein